MTRGAAPCLPPERELAPPREDHLPGRARRAHSDAFRAREASIPASMSVAPPTVMMCRTAHHVSWRGSLPCKLLLTTRSIRPIRMFITSTTTVPVDNRFPRATGGLAPTVGPSASTAATC